MPEISEPKRAKLYSSLEGAIGAESTEVLMDALNLDRQLATRDELRAVGDELKTELLATNTRIDGLAVEVRNLGTRLDALEARFDTRFETLETKFDSRFETLETKFDSRFETMEARIDAKLAGNLRSLFFTILGLMITMSGLVIAITKLV